MAKIKIKEGSLDVEVGPSSGKPVAAVHLGDAVHVKGNMVIIEFEPWGTKYKFQKGVLKKATAAAKKK